MTDLLAFILGLVLTALAATGIAQVTGAAVLWAPVIAGVAVAAPAPPAPAAEAKPAEAAPAPSQAKPAAKPKPNAKAKPKYTCEFDKPVRFGADGNTIINRACGYTDGQGRERSRDPWIDGQLEDAWARANPGAWALEQCQKQRGWTAAQCIADSKAGNSN